MRRTWLIFSQAVTVALAVLFVVATLKPEWLDRAPRVGVSPSAVSGHDAVRPAALPTAPAGGSYASAAQRAAPAVVSVITSKTAAMRGQDSGDPWFRYFFGDGDRQTQSGIGSGVIVSPEGYILTNNHVVDRMDDIEVVLADGRRTQAKVLGTDPETDLAVLRVDLDKLPAVAFGDADALRVGDVVLAIGNPFGVGQTVTFSSISPRPRWTTRLAVDCGLRAATTLSNCAVLATGVSATRVTTSPGRRPASLAGPPCSTPVISTPSRTFRLKVSAMSGVRSRGSTPIQPRVTRPSRTRPSSTWRAVDTGMAKPMPRLPPERE